SFLQYCNRYVKWVPSTTSARDEALWMLSVFYFVFDQKGIVEKQTPIDPAYIGKTTPLSNWLHEYADSLGKWMDTEDSGKLVSTFRTNPEYTVFEYQEPEGGWKTFNQFFSRTVNPVYRPICPRNTVASPCDAKFDGFWEIKDGKVRLETQTVKFKGIEWPIEQLLQDTELGKTFHNGVFMHSFLLPNNYHRVHAPVSGKVINRKTIKGDVYLEVTADPDKQKLLPLPRRMMPRKGLNAPEDVTAQDYAGYQWNQVRGMWVIDTDQSEVDDIRIGKVALFAVGMAQISSVNWDKQTAGAPNTQVQKGEEIGYLKYGGSDYILLFE
ncbi:phosphatidylserine decarboxylase-domain-containing protein, partial [Talaromyces proteolyticus]